MFAPRELGMSEFRNSSRTFHELFCCEPFTNDAVYTREQISGMLDRGDILEARAEEMLRMRYTLNSKGEKVIEK